MSSFSRFVVKLSPLRRCHKLIPSNLRYPVDKPASIQGRWKNRIHAKRCFFTLVSFGTLRCALVQPKEPPLRADGKNVNPENTCIPVHHYVHIIFASYWDSFILWLSEMTSKLYWTVVLSKRTGSICLRFFPLFLTYPLISVFPSCEELWWKAFLYVMESAGPTFIKLGQWASTRRDLFSLTFCEKFSTFHQEVSVHKWKHTEKILSKAFGEKWRELFHNFNCEAEPIGSGCVAQVYKANMKYEAIPLELREELSERRPKMAVEGLSVAIKVRHPGVEHAIHRDLVILSVMAEWASYYDPSLHWLSLTECVDQFAIVMEKQMDLEHEARCLDTFYHNFARSRSVFVPRPIWPYVRKDVLIETFEKGEHISKYVGDKNSSKRLKRKLAGLGIKTLLKMIFVDNFIHGDLHPGNILVQNAGKYAAQHSEDKLGNQQEPGEKKEKLRIVLLDVGITASMNSEDLKKFSSVFKAVVLGQGEKVADLFLTQSKTIRCSRPAVFKKEMSDLVKRTRSRAISLGTVKIADLLSEVFGLLMKHKIKVESHFASVLMALAVLEGLGRSLDPEIDILEFAKPFLLHGSDFETSTNF